MDICRRKYRRDLRKSTIKPLILFVLCIICYCFTQAASSDAVWPEASGEAVLTDGNLVLDYSHAMQGYVMVCPAVPTGNAMKLQVVFNGMQLLYDLNPGGGYIVVPLQLGSGTYVFNLFENAGGSKYAGVGRADLTVYLENENAAFLVANQYVDYTRESPSVLKSDELTAGMSQQDIFDKVCSFISSEFTYDFIRAVSISPGALPEVDSCYQNRSGICQDLSAVMISMLRVQGIPSKLMIGYADGYYHAWTVSVVNGEERFFDPTVAVNALQASSYTTERFY
ncbi:MAG: transglutaminase domain-containing protein [Blautia sp.]|nr:transglutaminase domain-containing protein [Blautia sp.]